MNQLVGRWLTISPYMVISASPSLLITFQKRGAVWPDGAGPARILMLFCFIGLVLLCLGRVTSGGLF